MKCCLGIFSNNFLFKFHVSRFSKRLINISSLPDSDELNNNVNNVTSTPKLLVKTKTYADITKRVDVMVLIDEVQRSQNEQSSRNVQQLNSRFITSNFDYAV